MISECVYYYQPEDNDYPELLKDALYEYDLGFVTYIFKRKGNFIECYTSVHYYSSEVVFSTFYKLPIMKGVKRRLKNITAKLICQTIPTIVFVQREPKYTILYSTNEQNDKKIEDSFTDNKENNYPEIEDSFSDNEEENVCSLNGLLSSQNLDFSNFISGNSSQPISPEPITVENKSQNETNCVSSSTEGYRSLKNGFVERLMSTLNGTNM